MYKKILNEKLVFPPHFSATAQDLLARVSIFSHLLVTLYHYKTLSLDVICTAHTVFDFPRIAGLTESNPRPDLDAF